MLQEDGERRLASLQADRDVGELCGNATQCGLVCLRRHARLVHALRSLADAFAHVVDALGVLNEGVTLNDSGLLQLGQLLLHVIQPAECGDRGVDLPEKLSQLFALIIQAAAHAIG
ncbi:hypothetical protein D3C77_311780 [compost metagenome]